MASRPVLLREAVDSLSGPAEGIDVARLAACIAGGQLLCEVPAGLQAKEYAAARAAADAWCTAIEKLAASRGSAARRAGSELVAVTAEQCGTDRLLAHYAAWGAAAASAMKEEAVGHAFDSACGAMRAIVGRMEHMMDVPGARKEVSSMCARAMGPVLLAAEAQAPAPTAAQLLADILRVSPGVVKSHMSRAETACVGAVARACSALIETIDTTALTLWSRCLCSLPLAGGGAEAWSALACRAFAEAHSLWDALAGGAEADDGPPAAARACLGHGTDLDAPSPLFRLSRHAPASTLAARMAGALHVIHTLLRGPAPAPAPLPLKPLALLAARALAPTPRVSDPDAAAALPRLSAAATHLVADALPLAAAAAATIHAPLTALCAAALSAIAACEGPLVPPAAPHPTLRRAIYALAASLAACAGPVAAARVAAAAMGAARVELFAPAPAFGSAGVGATGKSPGPSRKRKGAGDAPVTGLELAEGSAEALAEAEAMEAMGSGRARDATDAQCVALAMVEAVLAAGGAGMPGSTRAEADAVVALAARATGAALGASARAGSHAGVEDLGQLHHAALRALLTSILSPNGHRPPFLPIATSLFRSGLRSRLPHTRSLCQSALSSLEALLHPRASPMPGPYGGAGGSRARSGAYVAGAADAPSLPAPRFWHASAGVRGAPVAPVFRLVGASTGAGDVRVAEGGGAGVGSNPAADGRGAFASADGARGGAAGAAAQGVASTSNGAAFGAHQWDSNGGLLGSWGAAQTNGAGGTDRAAAAAMGGDGDEGLQRELKRRAVTAGNGEGVEERRGEGGRAVESGSGHGQGASAAAVVNASEKKDADSHMSRMAQAMGVGRVAGPQAMAGAERGGTAQASGGGGSGEGRVEGTHAGLPTVAVRGRDAGDNDDDDVSLPEIQSGSDDSDEE